MGFVRKLTGADAAEKGAQAQVNATVAGINEQRATREAIGQDVSPYQAAGTAALPQLIQAITQGNYRRNPLIDQITNDVTRRIFANQAARGRLGSTDTTAALTSALAPIILGDQQQQISNLSGLSTLGLNATGLKAGASQNIANAIQEGMAQQGNAQAGFYGLRAKAKGDLFNSLLSGDKGAGLSGAFGNILGSSMPEAGGAAAGGSGGGVMAGLATLFGLSDERAKENIEKVGELDNGLNVYKYNYKGSNRKTIGVLAQEVEQSNPNAVIEINGLKHVNYGAL